MKVSEIFNSIEGEGKRAGAPCTFIRLFGCNLRCTYCDSMYAVEGHDYTEMTVEEIIEKVKEWDWCKKVTVTGGEPLIQEDIKQLLCKLLEENFIVNVETNGSRPLIELPEGRSGVTAYELFYTIDFKTGTSGMMDKMCPKAFEHLKHGDVIKFVVGSEEDLMQAKDFCESHYLLASIYVSPIFGKIEPKDIVEFIQKNRLWNWKVQLQLHKYIWSVDTRGV